MLTAGMSTAVASRAACDYFSSDLKSIGNMGNMTHI